MSNEEEYQFEYGDYDLEEDVEPEPCERTYPDAPQQDDLEGLGAPGNAPRNGAEAIAQARTWSNNGHYVGVGYCLKTVREYYGVGAKYPDAAGSWQHAAHKRRVGGGRDVPRGVPVYWTGGSAGHGHIAISIGGGLCYSTDWKRSGRIDIASIDEITRRWGLHLEGYAWEVNDVVVWKPVPPSGRVRLSNLKFGKSNKDVLDVKRRLKKKGYKVKGILFTRKFSTGLRNAYSLYQKRLGYRGHDANGIPGILSLKKLGFEVVTD